MVANFYIVITDIKSSLYPITLIETDIDITSVYYNIIIILMY
jgi:hypothetical protein